MPITPVLPGDKPYDVLEYMEDMAKILDENNFPRPDRYVILPEWMVKKLGVKRKMRL